MSRFEQAWVPRAAARARVVARHMSAAPEIAPMPNIGMDTQRRNVCVYKTARISRISRILESRYPNTPDCVLRCFAGEIIVREPGVAVMRSGYANEPGQALGARVVMQPSAWPARGGGRDTVARREKYALPR